MPWTHRMFHDGYQGTVHGRSNDHAMMNNL